MSVYGDQLSIQNGRSSSEISIYGYPEHLNPFYEDENHKRIRFWKIGKNKHYNSSVSDKGSRRSSFSFAGIKDMWAFKSFRPKKSSALGVNKTSESPPRLQIDLRDTNYGTINNKSRYSTGQNNNVQPFQRNIPYRSSLQDMRYNNCQSTSPVTIRSNNGTGFGRNENYRATIQTPARMNRYNMNNGTMPIRSNPRYYQSQTSPKLQTSDRRYVYGGSITPQPKRNDLNMNERYYRGVSLCKQSFGSSELSVASSTNPFEDENDDENDKENLNKTWHGELNNKNSDQIVTKNNTNSLTRPVRKKRRAPPPPVPIPKMIEEEPIKTDEIKENGNLLKNGTNENSQITPEEKEISNLTAEITSFVNQTVEKNRTENAVPPTPPERKYFKEDAPMKESQICVSETDKTSEEWKNKKNNPPVIIINEPKLESPKKEVKVLKCDKSTACGSLDNEPHRVIVHTIVVHKDEVHTKPISDINSSNEKILNTDPNPVPIAGKITETENSQSKHFTYTDSSSIRTTSLNKEKPLISPKPNFNNENKNQIDTLNESNVTIDENQCKSDVSCELKITESTEDISAEIANEIVSLPYVPLKKDSSKNQVTTSDDHLNAIKTNSHDKIHEVVALRETKLENNFINNIRPRSHFADEEVENRRPIKYERKKSVREIIESINKNQSLLKIKNTKNDPDRNSIANNISEKNLKDLDESQRDFKRLLYEIDHFDDGNKINKENNINNENYNEIDKIINKIDELKKKENVFKKCTATHHINDNITTTTTIRTSLSSSRENSPTTSNLDWNPVPKPKRSKKLSSDLMTTSSSPESCNERYIE